MIETSPRVSVVIPNYNYERTLGAVLSAVLRQSHPVHEVIVVDDASTDGSRDVARRFPCTLLETGGNAGVSVARNVGAAAARGDVLFFLDSDIALCTEAVEQAVKILQSEPELGCVHGLVDAVPLYDDGPVERYRCLREHEWRRRGAGLVRTAFFALCAMPRAVFEEVGPFDESLRDAEDVEYSERLSARYPIRLTDRFTGRHDEADRLTPLLREQFRRSQLLVAFAATHRFSAGALKANRMPGVLAAAGVCATLPLVALAPYGPFVPLALLLLFYVADPQLTAFVVHRRGWRYLPQFMTYHFLVHVALIAGVAAGALRIALDRDFRRDRLGPRRGGQAIVGTREAEGAAADDQTR